MRLNNNKFFKSKWFQIIAYIFLVIFIGNMYAKAAGWFVIASSIGLAAYQFLGNSKFKQHKGIFKFGIGFMLFIRFVIGIGMSNTLTAKQQQVGKSTIKQTTTQAKKDKVAVVKTEVTKPISSNLKGLVNGQLKINFIDVGLAKRKSTTSSQLFTI